MAAAENYIVNIPWAEQIKYFKDKVNLPTEAWTDMWQGMHSRAFVVARTTKAELLCDLRAAMDTKYLGEHLTEKGKTNRAKFLPYLQDLIKDPQEVWLAFEQNAVSGKVRLSQRFLKYIDMGEAGGMIMSMMAAGGEMVNVTFIPRAKLGYLNNQRKGVLAYKF